MDGSEEVTSLRTEAAELQKTLVRTATVSLTLLFLVTIGFGRAMRRIDAEEIDKRLKEIRLESTLSNRDPDLSTALTIPYSKYKGSNAPNNPEQTSDEQAKHLEAMQAKVLELETIVTSWFTIKVSLLGSDLSFDLRYWMFFLPPFIWITSGYLWVTRVKLRALHRLARHRIDGTCLEKRLILDRLYFGDGPGRAAYTTEPARTATLLYIVALVSLLGYLAVSSRPLVSLFSENQWSPLYLFATLIVYAVAFPSAYGRSVDRQAEALSGREARAGLLERLVAAEQRGRVGSVLQLSRRSPRNTMSIGSVILLTSLFMTLAVDCNGHKFPGYRMLMPNAFGGDQDTVEWFSTDLAGLIVGPGHVVYAMSIVIAALTLITCIVSLFLKRVLGLRVLTVLSILVASFTVFDIGFAILLVGFNVFVIEIARVLAMLAAVGLWWFYALSRKAARRAVWQRRIRPAFLVAIAPGVIIAPVSLVIIAVKGFWGAYPFYLGSVLMAIGFTALADVTVAEQVEQARVVAPTTTPATSQDPVSHSPPQDRSGGDGESPLPERDPPE